MRPAGGQPGSRCKSPYVPLPEIGGRAAQRLRGQVQGELRRRRRKLEEKGRSRWSASRAARSWSAQLEEGFALEQSGWKGERGTAIAQDAATRGFYTELARDGGGYRASWRSTSCGSTGAAVGLPLRRWTHGGRYLLLKPGYDEALKECSPGQLLMEEVLEDCIARGLTGVRLSRTGHGVEARLDGSRARRHTWLFIFRDTPSARALCEAQVPLGAGGEREGGAMEEVKPRELFVPPIARRSGRAC